MSGVNEIRSAFLEFFAKRGHEIVASSPLVPRNDPTLMFANSGMVQFKNVFTGLETRAVPRAATAQKCVRAGGKHNDLDNVGYTARHHTFFEMLGNFSFGDYFKPDAIEYAWSFITGELGLPKDRLSVTVFVDDDEAYGLWRRIAGLPEDRIIRIATSDNFWRMGDVGPCGPCSEIFYDHGPHIPGGPPGSPDADGDRFIEVWNLVFMQYEEVKGGGRIALPRPSIDTGMGLERIAAVLQGTHDNYETDTMRALIRAVSETLSSDPDGPMRASHRVVADHLRASSFLIADGVLPSNEGRGYVLRRIMRRAMRHLQLLGAREAVMWRFVPALAREMGQAYPELLRASSLIAETLRLEETRFRRTLERGLGLLDAETATLAAGGTLSGEVAFRLYDTYGFPFDLTEDALRGRGLQVDRAGFDAAMETQKTRARANWAGTGEAASEAIWFALRDRLGATEFLGYGTESAEGSVLAVLRDGAEAAALEPGESGVVIVNQTPFYAESGGQVGDVGRLSGDALEADVTDVRKRAGDLFAHHVTLRAGWLTPGAPARLDVDAARRRLVRANHSATHLLHEALRRVLGDHVAQKGSLVAPDRLRFDISHPRPIAAEEIEAVEAAANAAALADAEVVTRLMAVDDAIASGARALFGEKYGEEVRVVSMGPPGEDGRAFSIELCGGTHVGRTGEIGAIAIVGEAGVSAGVRRIEALTGEAARRHLSGDSRQLRDAAALMKVQPAELVGRVAALMEERRKLERELSETRKRLAMGGGGDAVGPRVVEGIAYLARVVDGVEMKDLKGMVDEGKAQLGSGVVALVARGADGRASVAVGVTDDLTARFDAVALVRGAAEALGGRGGGGRRDLAQAGGPDGGKAEAAIEAVAAALAGQPAVAG
jgi:alanyl-tRNA synthetase